MDFGGFNLTKVHQESMLKFTSTRSDAFALQLDKMSLFGELVLDKEVNALIDTTSEFIQVPSSLWWQIIP